LPIKLTPIALTIAGSDPSGGAGIQADLKTFHQHGVFGMSVITLITAQNTKGVTDVEVLSDAIVGKQLTAVLDDIPPLAAKTGALGNSQIICEIATAARRFTFPLVVDPVMISKHGAPLLDSDGVTQLRERLLPLAFLVTPNLPEAEALTGVRIRSDEDRERAARMIIGCGARSVLIKGGHAGGAADDLLYLDGQAHWIRGERLASRSTHGTGCVLSAAITARLVRGEGLLECVTKAKAFVAAAIASASVCRSGAGPTNMHAEVID
jgi:hydroxymethylpyrimidine/phosphomethylpyrimidine kinase